MSTRSQALKLRRLIEERDPDLLSTVAHLARSLDDGDVVDSLLKGATYEKRAVEPGDSLRSLPRKTRHHARMATLALIATGIGERARTLRARIERLEFSHAYRDRHGNHEAYDPATPVDLELLVGLPLHTLRVNGLELVHPELLSSFGALEALVVDTIDPDHLRDLSRLRTLMAGLRGNVVPTLPACEELQVNASGPLRIEPQPKLLTLTTWNRARVHLTRAPELYRAEMTQAHELIVDEPLPALRHLHCGGTIQRPERLVALEHLRTRSLEGVAELPRLRCLELEGALTSLAELKGRPVDLFRGPDRSLTTLEGYPRSSGAPHRQFPALRSLHGIEAIQGIETLELRKIESLDGIEPLRETLRGLDLRDCHELRDVDVLRDFDLRAILIAGTQLQAKDFAETLQWAVVRERKASVAALAMRSHPELARD